MAFIGLPMVALETVIGQLYQESPVLTVRRLAFPGFKGNRFLSMDK
jgi:SNF family Na+-dependent transporter